MALSPAANPSLERLRLSLAEKVERDGLDAHQVAAFELAWAVARSSAAAATEDWAGTTGDELANLIATAARREESAALTGLDAAGQIESGEALARIGELYRPLEELGDGDEQRLLRRTFSDFARQRIAPLAQQIHRSNLDVPESIIEGAAGLGLFGLSVPEEYGGSQSGSPDHRTMLIVTEELSRASLGAGGSLITRPEILVRALLKGGTEEQKRRWLPAIASGEKLVAVGVT